MKKITTNKRSLVALSLVLSVLCMAADKPIPRINDATTAPTTSSSLATQVKQIYQTALHSEIFRKIRNFEVDPELKGHAIDLKNSLVKMFSRIFAISTKHASKLVEKVSHDYAEKSEQNQPFSPIQSIKESQMLPQKTVDQVQSDLRKYDEEDARKFRNIKNFLNDND